MMKKMTMLIMMLPTLASCSSKAATDAAQIVTDTAADVHDDASADDDFSEADDGAVTDADDDAASTDRKVHAVEDLVTYYNDAATEEEQIACDEEHQYWIYTGAIHTESSDKETLRHTVHRYLDYAPLYRTAEDGYMFRYREHYDEDENSYVCVAVSSNRFAAMTIESRWASSELTTTVIAYDGRSGLYMQREII